MQENGKYQNHTKAKTLKRYKALYQVARLVDVLQKLGNMFKEKFVDLLNFMTKATMGDDKK